MDEERLRDPLPLRAPLPRLERFCRAVLGAAGADAATAEAASRAMLHASRLGVDSHGVRLLAHYADVLRQGRVNPAPRLRFEQRFPAVASLDADDGHGALAGYRAMERAVELAEAQGLGAVGIRRSSHFGAAGAYALAAAERGLIGLAVCNADAFVRLHDGARRFHGTNPLAAAAPAPETLQGRPGGRPWLLDMATSAIPFNRVQLYRSLGQSLPPGVASDAGGRDTCDPEAVEMLAPLGGAQGYKGAGLAGLVEILAAVTTGMTLSAELLPMFGPDRTTPRRLGAFVLALRPDAFVAPEAYADTLERYLILLRGSIPAGEAPVLAPGDREWREAAERDSLGVPLDPATVAEFRALSERFSLSGLCPWSEG